MVSDNYLAGSIDEWYIWHTNNVFVPLTAGVANTICPTGCIGIYRHGPLDADDRGDEHRDRDEHHDERADNR